MNALLLSLVKGALPYAAAGVVGFSLAYGLQGLRLTHAEQEFTQYRQDQTALIQLEKDQADRQREKASEDYAHLSDMLTNEINKGVVYQRCVAAGKCGACTLAVRVRDDACGAAGLRLPSASGTDAAGADAVLAGAGTAAEDPVVGDCAVTTLMLNQLQTDIENQPGYGGRQ